MTNVEKACEITDEIMIKLKSVIHAPLTYKEVQEEGNVVFEYTEFGEAIYDIIYSEIKNKLNE